MEPQCTCNKTKKRSAIDIVLFMLMVALGVVAGTIFGAIKSAALLPALSALYIFTAIIGLLIIVTLIYSGLTR